MTEPTNTELIERFSRLYPGTNEWHATRGDILARLEAAENARRLAEQDAARAHGQAAAAEKDRDEMGHKLARAQADAEEFHGKQTHALRLDLEAAERRADTLREAVNRYLDNPTQANEDALELALAADSEQGQASAAQSAGVSPTP